MHKADESIGTIPSGRSWRNQFPSLLNSIARRYHIQSYTIKGRDTPGVDVG